MDVAPIFASISFPFLERCCNFCIMVIFYFFFLRMDTLQILNYEDVSLMDECKYPDHASDATEIIST